MLGGTKCQKNKKRMDKKDKAMQWNDSRELYCILCLHLLYCLITFV